MKLGIYCRISRLKDGNDLSINDQKTKGIAKAKELSISYELYVDEGKSGASDKIENRPEFDRLLTDIVNDEITAVYAFDYSRLERNPQVRWYLNDIFKRKNIQYYTEIDGLIDLHDPQREFFGDMQSLINKYHVTLTKIKVKSALKTRVEAGKAHSILPYGYGKDEDGYLIIDEEESKVVKKIYELSLSGIGTRSIAEYLTENEISTRYNKIGKGTISTKNRHTKKITTTEKKNIKWAGNTIRNIIKNTIYKGERYYSGNIYKVPAILSEDYWHKVNNHLIENRNNSGKKVEHQYLLKGLMRCGICGRNMYGRKRVDKHDNVYICSSKRIKGENCGNRGINIDKIESLIWDKFFEDDLLLNRVKKELEKDDNEIKEIKKEIDVVEKRIKNLELEKKRAIELVIKGTLTEEDVTNILKKNKNKTQDLKVRRENLIVKGSSIENRENLVEKHKDDFLHYTKNTSFTQKKEIVNDYIHDIIVNYDDVFDSYLIKIIFKADLGVETYKTFDRFTVIQKGSDFIVPQTLGKSKFRKPAIIQISGNNDSLIHGNDEIPYKDIGKGDLYPVFNTRVPYGNVDDWSEDEINDFFNDNPDWYCKESGVSLNSKYVESPDYQNIVMKYQDELKKNYNTPTLDTNESEIV